MGLIFYGQDQDYLAFKDRSPAAEHHILVVPKIHVGEIWVFDRKSARGLGDNINSGRIAQRA